ncbi:hypothetical protein DB32_008944 [Sandaracinus amylolyticus]|uniref:Uncharacterized protein n=1 Tax=Sandaracinus amylolyticus TaxID=927083 RepID=A0A0F6YND3_9BACT|nr:hypothetical protein DB32_008944 [Sandaracinus amylolyticus]
MSVGDQTDLHLQRSKAAMVTDVHAGARLRALNVHLRR